MLAKPSRVPGCEAAEDPGRQPVGIYAHPAGLGRKSLGVEGGVW